MFETNQPAEIRYDLNDCTIAAYTRSGVDHPMTDAGTSTYVGLDGVSAARLARARVELAHSNTARKLGWKG